MLETTILDRLDIMPIYTGVKEDTIEKLWSVHKDKISACLITVDDNGKEQIAKFFWRNREKNKLQSLKI